MSNITGMNKIIRGMKKIMTFFLCVLLSAIAFAQKPSKEQMEADKKRMAEAMKKLNEKTSGMSPDAKRGYDSLLNSMGVGQKMNNAISRVNSNQSAPSGKLIPVKNTKAIAATPSNANMDVFVGTTGTATFAAVLPAAKNKAGDIYKALKQKGATTDEMGNAATALWVGGRTQIALSLMAQVCKDDAGNTDNLNNYAAMLTMMGSPEMAIPILNNLNGRFKKNSTILNNLGQAWFALGDADKAKKYLDTTLALSAAHAQANETMCMIAESKGNKTAATAAAKTAFKQGYSNTRADLLKNLGYTPGTGDYNNFPPANKSDDLLNLGPFSAMEFPKSYADMKMYEIQRRQFLAEIDKLSKPLKQIADESKKATLKQMEAQQKQFMNVMNKSISSPGAVSQAEALAIMRVPMFSKKMNAREKLMIENLQRKKNTILQKMADFRNGDGAVYKTAYDATMKKINERWKNVGEGGSENNEVLCSESVKAVDTYLSAFNTKYEDLYNEYLTVQKQFLNEMSYLSLYTTYSELLPAINAGLKLQWLNDLSFNAEVIGVSYGCSNEGKIRGGKLTQFKDPNCTINSEFSQNLGLANLGFSIKLDCSGITTTVNVLALGFTLNQDLDHAGFGDSFKSCTVSIGPKASVGGKIGPLEASVNVGGGVDIEIDRTGVTDVIAKAGAEIESGFHNPGIDNPGSLGTAASGSAGVEGRMSLNTGAGSLNGTGIFK
jgi:tetratricopeptide (TPR) repeat protein